MDHPRDRVTLPGEIPTSWKRPPRSTVTFLLVASLTFVGFMAISAGDLQVLDERLAYGPQTVVSFIGGLDEAGRAAYLAFNVADGIFIVVYSTLFVTWIAFLRNRLAIHRYLHPALGVLPGLADALETLAVGALLRTEVVSPNGWVWLAVVSTPVKWTLAVATVIVVLVGEVRWIRRQRARRREATRRGAHARAR